MARKKQPKKDQLNFRPTATDKAIIQAGMQKHGIDQSQIVRMALRRFAEAENIKVEKAS